MKVPQACLYTSPCYSDLQELATEVSSIQEIRNVVNSTEDATQNDTNSTKDSLEDSLVMVQRLSKLFCGRNVSGNTFATGGSATRQESRENFLFHIPTFKV